ncbi:tyrosine recombinase XerC [Papillibacter cinnamivorans]|uniref:Site-specific recombinase XerD n=1 Tax=Papillibacter cinnamivorans DSM 12816 TaxID=1122930 RepID=A0A1W1ZPV2_9FIRM|nr:tyrosine recombinase XerC [Papillibacter cinnamivorans]SMC50449.1 Site-specific recombinase XerD [Papillibacter cinnamivorans DSM 12816]
MDYRNEAPGILRDFLAYHETIKGHSKKTVDEYFLDLRNFFRYLKIRRDKVPRETDMENVSILDVDLELVKSVTLTDIYEYMSFLSRDKVKNHKSRNPEYGLNAASRARKVACIRSFYKYLTNKARLMEENPVKDLDSPKLKRSLPRYLSLEESIILLSNVGGKHPERDYCILTLFLNCGLRISELTGLNVSDVREDHLRVLGKGGKERIVYLNDACLDALKAYREIRSKSAVGDKGALFLSQQHKRISRATVHSLVKHHLAEAGLDSDKYSSHKLRHTAATLMLQNGVDVRALQEVLGHEHLNTTEIYTHVDNEALRTAARANPLSRVRRNKKRSG